VAEQVYAVHVLHRRWTRGCQVPADNAACCMSEPEQCLQHTASISETTQINRFIAKLMSHIGDTTNIFQTGKSLNFAAYYFVKTLTLCFWMWNTAATWQ